MQLRLMGRDGKGGLKEETEDKVKGRRCRGIYETLMQEGQGQPRRGRAAPAAELGKAGTAQVGTTQEPSLRLPSGETPRRGRG